MLAAKYIYIPTYRVAIEADAAGIYVEPVEDLRQRLVEAEHDLDLAVGKLRHQGNRPQRPDRVDLGIFPDSFFVLTKRKESRGKSREARHAVSGSRLVVRQIRPKG